MSDVTRLLSQVQAGDPAAAELLLPLVYEELRKLAAARLALEKPGQTLQATALVHEAYLRLIGSDGDEQSGNGKVHWDSRGHFFAAAAEAMRRLLVEGARRKSRVKRGGHWQRVDLNEQPAAGTIPNEEIVALDEALTRLAAEDAEAARIVHLHFFCRAVAGTVCRRAGRVARNCIPPMVLCPSLATLCDGRRRSASCGNASWRVRRMGSFWRIEVEIYLSGISNVAERDEDHFHAGPRPANSGWQGDLSRRGLPRR